MAEKLKKHQALMLRKRGMNPDDYVVVKNTFTSLYVRNTKTGIVKIIDKYTGCR